MKLNDPREQERPAAGDPTRAAAFKQPTSPGAADGNRFAQKPALTKRSGRFPKSLAGRVHKTSSADDLESVASATRTERLILAAVKVWELKKG